MTITISYPGICQASISAVHPYKVLSTAIASAMKLISLFLCLTIVNAFTSPNSRTVAKRVLSSKTLMASPLEEVPEGEEALAEPMESTAVDQKTMAKNYGRDGELKEVKWVDPAMSANTNPLEMDFWAYPFVLLPFIILLNDFFHFVPESVKESPIGVFF